MKIIGLTGGIGTGKTTVAGFFMKAGIPVLEADSIAHHIYVPGSKAYGEIVETFGQGVLSPDGTINRHLLGERVFHHPRKRLKLEKITHPKIESKMREFVWACREENKPCCVIEAALIFEKNRGELFDLIVTVFARRENQIARLKKRDRLTAEEIGQRIGAQLPIEEKVKRADFVIDNSGTLVETKKQVRDLIKILKKT
jgi:dephospho-CoA kinase